MSNILKILVLVLVILSLMLNIEHQDDDKYMIYLDDGYPLYQDDNFDINSKNNTIITNKIAALLSDYEVMVSDQDDDIHTKSKEYNKYDLAISIHSEYSDHDHYDAYVDKNNKDLTIFDDLDNFEGKFYYDLTLNDDNTYRQSIRSVDEDYDDTLGFLENCHTKCIWLNIYYEDDVDDNRIKDIVNSIIEYVDGEMNEG